MTDPSKIRLSADELELMRNADIILTKNRILLTLRSLLETIGQQVQQDVPLQTEMTRIPPKVSRGENYQGLPWLMLDYPRIFTKENTCAIRTMFWWGRCFSITLQLAGTYKARFENKIAASRETLKDAWICISNEAWEHHFGPDNYRPVSETADSTFRDIILQKDFLKISYKIPLHEPEKAMTVLTGFYRQFLTLLRDGDKG